MMLFFLIYLALGLLFAFVCDVILVPVKYKMANQVRNQLTNLILSGSIKERSEAKMLIDFVEGYLSIRQIRVRLVLIYFSVLMWPILVIGNVSQFSILRKLEKEKNAD